MSALPTGWEKAKLGSLADFVMGQAPPGSACNKTGEGTPFVKAGEFGELRPVIREWTTQPLKIAGRDDVLICVVGATSGKINLGEDCAIGRSVAAIRPNQALDQLYLYNFLRTKVLGLRGGASGSAQGVISKDALCIIDIPVPPATEQHRIVTKLQALFTYSSRAQHELNSLSKLLKRYKKAILGKAFSGELTADWRKSHSLPLANIRPLSDCAEHLSYGSGAKSAPEGRVPVLRMGNIQDGELDWTNLVYTSDEAEIEKYKLIQGDVLFNRTNSPELVGKTALYRGDREAIYAGYLIRVRCSDDLLPAYLTYCLNSPQGRDYCWRVKTDGVSQSNINAKKLAAFEFIVPTLDEQAEIVRRVETAFAWIEKIAAEQGRADHLLPKLDQAILSKAFRGELVPQDPSDEPASKLLERLPSYDAPTASRRRLPHSRARTRP